MNMSMINKVEQALRYMNINLDVFDPVERETVHGKTLIKVYLEPNEIAEELGVTENSNYDPYERVPYVELVSEDGDLSIVNGIAFPINGEETPYYVELNGYEEGLVIEHLTFECEGKLKEDLVTGRAVRLPNDEVYFKSLVGLPGISKQ